MQLNNVINTANNYATQRALQVSNGNNRAKFGMKDLKEELALAAVFGELSALERMMTVIIEDKAMTRTDIEAELHLSIVDYYKFIKTKLGDRYPHINLEKYLEMRGYYDKSTS
jgi:hypothetical protein